MAGRAGRRGIDTEGFCISLNANKEQEKTYKKLIASSPNKLESNLKLDFSYIMNYLSEFKDIDELRYILSKSLFTFDNTTQKTDAKKLEDLIETFTIKKEILENNNYIDKNGNITTKGLNLENLQKII